MILKKLVKRDEFYSIRIKIGENKYIKSSIKAVRRISFFFGQKFIIYSQKCSLISSELRDYIGLHMSQQGDLISLNYWTKTIECSNELIVTFVVDPKVFFFPKFFKELRKIRLIHNRNQHKIWNFRGTVSIFAFSWNILFINFFRPKLAAPKVEPEPAKKQQQQEQQEEPGFFSKYVCVPFL